MTLASIEECTGCGACASVCTKGCISMQIGENGFFYPNVRIEGCIECGLCTKSCHIINRPTKQTFESVYYFGWDKSRRKRFEGSSGGIFGAIAEYVLYNGGIVYGAAFSLDKKSLLHTSTKEVALNDLKKSKYLESYMGTTIRRIKKDLLHGHMVLFCGTPCQVNGVRQVLGYRYENLILCDFVCHGVPSSMRYKQYIEELESMYGAKVKNVGFRTKLFGWKTYCIVIEFQNGKRYIKLAKEDPYYEHFFSWTNLRPSCYSCNRVANSSADITLGDMWEARKRGIKDDDKGISLIICNNPKGYKMISQLPSLLLKRIDQNYSINIFNDRNIKKRTTSIHQQFFSDFTIPFKDKLKCIVLKYKLFRMVIYKIK